MYDILIKGGTILDGTGKPGYIADIAIAEDRIVDIGSFGQETAHRIIHATGLTISPGFVDIHSHTDISLFVIRGRKVKFGRGLLPKFLAIAGRLRFLMIRTAFPAPRKF
jgi:N-acyl-D-amino-acid deacylase